MRRRNCTITLMFPNVYDSRKTPTILLAQPNKYDDVEVRQNFLAWLKCPRVYDKLYQTSLFDSSLKCLRHHHHIAEKCQLRDIGLPEDSPYRPGMRSYASIAFRQPATLDIVVSCNGQVITGRTDGRWGLKLSRRLWIGKRRCKMPTDTLNELLLFKT